MISNKISNKKNGTCPHTKTRKAVVRYSQIQDPLLLEPADIQISKSCQGVALTWL